MNRSKMFSALHSILMVACGVLIMILISSCAAPQPGGDLQGEAQWLSDSDQDIAYANDGEDDPPQSRWPMQLQAGDSQVVIYQPQLIDFDGNKLKGRAAVAVTKTGQTTPTFGAIWLNSRVSTDRVSRTVEILDVNVTQARFPNGGGPSAQALTTAISEATQRGGPMTLSLDQLLAMVQVVEKQRQASKEIANDPPKILFRDHPVVLVSYDGAPRTTRLEDSKLFRVDNSPFFVVEDPSSGNYYLKGAGLWFIARDAMGPFKPIANVPPTVAALAQSSGYADPQQPLKPEQVNDLEIITASEPTEVIWTDGPEQIATIPDTGLLYVSNTESDLFMVIDTQQFFVLLSGRWYTASSRQGPWTFVQPDQLPADFKRIPPTSEKGDVLAHVAGTQAAKDALADSFVPQTAVIDRKNAEPPTVTYDGDPAFEPVEKTGLRYAVNSPYSVLYCNGFYYCCYQGVWYIALGPRGPWDVCTSVPSDIYTIPPSCPLYPVRYVYVYDWTPDYVYCGYLPGYLGCYYYGGVIVYGTGYHYHGWHGHHYYPHPCTFGFGAHYDGYQGYWGFAVGFGIDGGRGWFSPHHHDDGHHHGENGWFGHGGYRPPYSHTNAVHHPAAGSPQVRHDDLNIYNRRRDATSGATVHRTAAPRAGAAQPAAARIGSPAARTAPRNNVFTDPNGQVYRKTIDGWEGRDHDRWAAPSKPAAGPSKSVPAPSKPGPTPSAKPAPAAPGSAGSSLNRDYRARIDGAQRPHNYPSAAPSRGSAPSRSGGVSSPPRGGVSSPSRGSSSGSRGSPGGRSSGGSSAGHSSGGGGRR